MKNEKLENRYIQEVKYVSSGAGYDAVQLVPEKEANQKSDTWYLYFTTLTGMLLICSGSTSMVWASPAVVKLKSNNTDINPLGRPITTLETSMLLGIPILVAAVGPLIFPKLADLIGRKKSLQIVGVGLFAGIIGQALSYSVVLIITFCSITSALYFAALSILPVYLTEVCEDHNRGKYGCIMSGFIPLGNLYVYAVGPAFSLRMFTLLTAAPLVPFLVLFWFAPESPVYSLSKGSEAECINTLSKLRSNNTVEELEMDLLKLKKHLLAIEKKKMNNVFTLFKSKEARVGFMFALLPFFVRIFSGVLVVMALLAPILNEAKTNLSGQHGAIIVGVVSVISSIIPCFVVEKFGRKPLLLISSVGAGICVSILGVFFYLKHIGFPMIETLQLLPLISISFYIVFYFIGLGPVPFAIVAELFLSDIRSVAVGILLSVLCIILFLVGFMYPLLVDAFGIYWCLWIFGGSCFLGAILIHVLLPETKGKSILEIQDILRKS